MKRTRNVLKVTLKLIKSNGHYPNFIDLAQYGITRSMVRESFGSLDGLKAYIAKHHSDVIFDLNGAKINSKIPKSKVYVITCAVTESKVHEGFKRNLDVYCKVRGAQLIIQPVFNKAKGNATLDPILADACIMLDKLALNENITLVGIKNNSRGVDPSTGLPRAEHRGSSIIVPSTKQRLKYIATGIDKLPNAIMSPGSITIPNYTSSYLMIDKSSYLAGMDHVMGAVIVEIQDNKIFHFRQIQADEKGTFIDLGVRYKNGKAIKEKAEALVLGDWHSGEGSPTAISACIEQIKLLKPKYLILHDFYSGNSTSHHVVGKEITLGKMAKAGKLSIESELSYAAKDLDMLAKLVDNVVIIKSNHDDFLERYLNEGRYIKDSHNHILALELASAMAAGHNPVKYGVEKFGSKAKNVRWLAEDESFMIANIECGQHGHRGSNGGKPSINSLENAYLNSITGHSHTPQIQRGVYVVGTTTETNPDYGKGATSWMNCNAVVYSNGQRQLINSIKGSWKI